MKAMERFSKIVTSPLGGAEEIASHENVVFAIVILDTRLCARTKSFYSPRDVPSVVAME
jgi:hypothetical protein